MARKPKTQTPNTSMRVQTVEEWLALGNKITVCPPGARSEDLEPMGSPRGYGKRKKKAKKDAK